MFDAFVESQIMGYTCPTFEQAVKEYQNNQVQYDIQGFAYPHGLSAYEDASIYE